MNRLLDHMFAHGRTVAQRGITGAETAIVIAAGAAVIATMAATLYASAVGGSGDTVYAELQEATSGLEPRGGVVGFTGTLPDGNSAIYKVGFVIAGAPDAEPVDLNGAYRADGTGLNPVSAPEGSGTSGLSVSYRLGDVVVENVPWTVRFLGFSDGDMILETDEKAQLSVWLLDRDGRLEIDVPGSVTPRDHGTGLLPPLGAGDEFTIEVKSQPEGVLLVTRIVPEELTPILDMK